MTQNKERPTSFAAADGSIGLAVPGEGCTLLTVTDALALSADIQRAIDEVARNHTDDLAPAEHIQIDPREGNSHD